MSHQQPPMNPPSTPPSTPPDPPHDAAEKARLRRQRVGEKIRAAWANPQRRAKKMAKLATTLTPEKRAAMGARSRARWADPKVAAKHAASAKKAWRDPAKRSRMHAAITSDAAQAKRKETRYGPEHKPKKPNRPRQRKAALRVVLIDPFEARLFGGAP